MSLLLAFIKGPYSILCHSLCFQVIISFGETMVQGSLPEDMVRTIAEETGTSKNWWKDQLRSCSRPLVPSPRCGRASACVSWHHILLCSGCTSCPLCPTRMCRLRRCYCMLEWRGSLGFSFMLPWSTATCVFLNQFVTPKLLKLWVQVGNTGNEFTCIKTLECIPPGTRSLV